MKNKMKNIILSVACVAVLSSGVVTAGALSTAANATNVGVWSTLSSEIQTEYAYGTVFSVPERTITVNGIKTTAKSSLELPNGSSTLNTSVPLTLSGNYTLRYTANVNGKNYLDEYQFYVVGVQASVGSAKSSIAYGAYSYDVDRMALTNATTGETKNSQYTYTCEEGLMVRLSRGDTLQFHEIIDLSNVTQADSLVKAFATPDEQGTPDFEKLIFTFTDVYDPSIALSFISQHTLEGYDYRKTYSMVAGNGQKQSGLDFTDPNKIYVGTWGTSGDGSYTRRFKPVYQNANGVWVDDYKEQDAMPIDFRYDSQTKSAYLRDYRNATRVNKIADLDDPEHFDTLWGGFTNGKVRLSISADVYSADTANFCVSYVRGLDLTKTEYRDEQAPVLDIQTNYQKMPSAVVGGTYPVPSATAFDLNVGACKVKTSVWYNYASNAATSVAITGNTFKTDKFGDYAIVYEASDGNGNTAKEILWVRAEKQLPQMQIQFTSDKLSTATCGDWIVPTSYEIVNAVGDSSDVTTTVTVTFDGQTIDAVSGFRPEKQGEYKIVVTATDYIGRTVSETYTVSVKKADKPTFIQKANLPFAFVSGMQYKLPTLFVSDYTSGALVQSLAYAELSDKNGTRRLSCGDTFVPTVAKTGDTVKIVYKYDYQGSVVQSEEYLIPTVIQKGKNEENKTRLFISNYLIGGGFTTQTKKNEIIITAEQADGGWTFAKDLIAEGFSVKLRGAQNNSRFQGLRITLQDFENDNQKVTVYAQNLTESVMFYVGEQTVKVNNSFHVGGGFSIGYTQNTITIDAIRVGVTQYDNGLTFNGFTSNKVLLSVAFDGAQTGAQYSMESLCGEITGTLASDSSSPLIVVLGDCGGLGQIGEEKLLPKAIASDLLDPNVSFTMSVFRPDLSVATDVNGKELKDVDPCVDYTIRMEQFGQYMVSYTAVDSVGNKNAWSYPIIVKDETPPKLTFESGTKQAKVGDTLVLPNFKVSDNVTAAKNLVVTKFVYAPNGKLYQLPEKGNSIVCTQVGVYEFRVMVVDEEGNVAMYTYSITVTK